MQKMYAEDEESKSDGATEHKWRCCWSNDKENVQQQQKTSTVYGWVFIYVAEKERKMKSIASDFAVRERYTKAKRKQIILTKAHRRRFIEHMNTL